MSDEAQSKPAKRASGKSTTPRKTAKPKAAASTVGLAKVARVSVPVVPEAQAPLAGSLSRRASALRLGLLTTTLAMIVGGFAWFTESPEHFASSPMQAASGSQSAFPSADPLAAHVSQSLEQDQRLATLALDIQQSQESISRLWADAESLAANVGALAKGIDTLKSDVGTARIDASASIARLEERLHEVKLAAMAEPARLGDPTLQVVTQLGYPDIAQVHARVAAASEPAQPATTGGLPQAEPAPQASVEVSFNKPKARAKAAKPISGWLVHNAREDFALVQSEGAHYEVRPGELLPGVGIVRAIKKRGEQWVVLTSKGMITEAR
jgi:hypothetical protein